MKKAIILLMILVIIAVVSGCGKASQIQGVLDKVEYIKEEKRGWAPSGKTVVRFKDGRIKAFLGVSGETFQEGKINIITYGGDPPMIYSVVVKDR